MSAPNVTSLPQASQRWLDVGAFEDLVFTIDVRETTNTSLKLTYETAPSRQEGLFLAMLPAFALAVGRRVDRVFTNMAAVPPARFVRWRMICQTPGSVYDATFRIWVAAFAWRRT